MPVPPEVIAKLQSLQRRLSDELQEVSWSRINALHLTIRFFGNVAGERLDELQKAIQNICASAAPFPVRAEQVGCFGERVIWVGVGGAWQRLREMESQIKQATIGFGDHEEAREFRPHLTIGRVKKWRAGRVSVADKLVGLAGAEFGGWTVDHLELMRSELLPQGARYTCLATIPLAGKLPAEE